MALSGKFTKLTIAQIAAIPNFFAGVELLTLSACETAVGDEASRHQDDQGVEVESLGVLAQRKGASAVIASLWEVADVSTSKLMQNFYQCHASATVTTKAEALRQAQMDLLLKTNGEYSHPFYWAHLLSLATGNNTLFGNTSLLTASIVGRYDDPRCRPRAFLEQFSDDAVPADQMRIWPISPGVNSPINNDADIVSAIHI